MAKRKGQKPARRAGKSKSKKAAAASVVKAWQDDPISKRPPIDRPVPDPTKKLQYKIKGPAVAPDVYEVGTKEFRYWTASESLRRCSDYWTGLGLTRWQLGPVLPVSLDKGQDLNAFYDRSELAFFHGKANDGTTVFSGESPDIVCHEMGHAILDAHRPELFDVAFIEVGSFHEFFGDASAILAALQLPEVVEKATAPLKANKNSFLSRVAEQLGFAIRTFDPDAVDKDSLRNAFNRFKYVSPENLDVDAPATELSAAVHSFSRVFTGAFYEILSGMLGASDVSKAATDLGKLLLEAVKAAPIDPRYFAQVAAHMIDADAAKFNGKYRQTLVDVFVARKILSADLFTASKPKATKGRPLAARPTKAQAVAATRPAVGMGTRTIELDGGRFGLSGKLVAKVPAELKQLGMMPASVAHRMTASDARVNSAVEKFVASLLAHGRVKMAGPRPARALGMVATRGGRGRTHSKLKTHELVKIKGGHSLKRLGFVCGDHWS